MATTSLTSFPKPEFAVCPNCSAEIKLYDPAGSEFCTCDSCQSFLQFVNEEPVKLKNTGHFRLDTIIPLGSEGTLKDIPFKVIGILEKHEHNPAYTWHEYLLYNYEKGYATLSEYQGHWNIIFGSNFLPKLDEIDENFVSYEGTTYRVFNRYTPYLAGVKGEFDWNVYKDKLRVSEFIAPPFIISLEKEKGVNGESHYYRGEYLEPIVVAQAFGLDFMLFPEKQGIGANQPSKAQLQWPWVFTVTLVLMLAVFVIEFIVSQVKSEKSIMAQTFDLVIEPPKVANVSKPSDSTGLAIDPTVVNTAGMVQGSPDGINEFKSFRSPTFEIEDISTSLDMELGSNQVNNNWLEATVVLVNEATNQTWEVTKGIEYYQGVEDGESWSEGELATKVLLSEIPKGKYHLNIYPASGDAGLTSMSVNIHSNTTLWRNLLVWVLVLCIYPAFLFWRMQSFERKRWMNSDFSPFESDDE